MKIFILVIALIAVAYSSASQKLLRHQFDFNPSQLSTAASTFQTCKDVGNKWNSVTGAVDSVTGTWQGDECNSKCEAQKGTVCGKILRDCCAMTCEGGFFAKYCKFDLKLTRAMMKCGA
jgi:hypothetical protein